MNTLNNNQNNINRNIYAMTKKLLLFILTLVTINIYAQSPEAISYQAVVRDGSGNIIANQAVGIQLTILQTSVSGTVVYRETFSETTNGFGLINVAIGTGTPSTGTLGSIDWSAGPYFVETSIDPAGGTSYVSMGTSQLLSVPYALYAENSGDSKWKDATLGIGYVGGNVGIGTLDAGSSSQFLVASAAPSPSFSNIKITNEDPNGATQISLASDPNIANPFTNLEMVLGINNSSNVFGANEAYLWYFDDYDLKFGTNSTERLRIKNTGNIEVKTGDVYIENIGSGVIMKSPDGNCWRMTVDNTGNPVFTSITCP